MNHIQHSGADLAPPPPTPNFEAQIFAAAATLLCDVGSYRHIERYSATSLKLKLRITETIIKLWGIYETVTATFTK